MRVSWPSSEATSLHDAVVLAATRTYQARGVDAIPYWEPNGNGARAPFTDLRLPELRRVEEIETDDSFDKVDISHLIALREQGLDVWMLVPLERLGAAHDQLRGAVSRLQSWWLKDGAIRFGRPERA